METKKKISYIFLASGFILLVTGFLLENNSLAKDQVTLIMMISGISILSVGITYPKQDIAAVIIIAFASPFIVFITLPFLYFGGALLYGIIKALANYPP